MHRSTGLLLANSNRITFTSNHNYKNIVNDITFPGFKHSCHAGNSKINNTMLSLCTLLLISIWSPWSAKYILVHSFTCFLYNSFFLWKVQPISETFTWEKLFRQLYFQKKIKQKPHCTNLFLSKFTNSFQCFDVSDNKRVIYKLSFNSFIK